MNDLVNHNPDEVDSPSLETVPDHIKIINLATEVSFQEMLEPALISVLLPLFIGSFFGVHALLSLIAGTILSSLSLSITTCNVGDAWASAKRAISRDYDPEKSQHIFKAVGLSDSFGNPMKVNINICNIKKSNFYLKYLLKYFV